MRRRTTVPFLRLLLGVVLSIGAGSLLDAQELITLDPDRAYERLGGHWSLLRDETGSASLTELPEAGFLPEPRDEPSLGFDRAAWWARFSVRAAAGGGSWILECAYPPMDLVELTTVRGGRVVAVQRAGDSIPSREHPFPARTYRFALAADTSVTTTYYIRMKTEGPIHASFRIWETRALADADLRQHLYLGAYFGLMVVMALYAAFFLLFSRELTYLYYIGYVVFHALFQAVYVGIAMRYLWPQNAWWASRSLVVFGSLSVAFSALFTREFLRGGTLVPHLLLLMDACLAISLGTCVISLVVPYALSILVTNITLVVFSAIYVLVGILALRRGYTPARLYLMAWTVLLVAVFWVGIANFGVFEVSGFSANPLQIGSIVEVLLLSLAISDRINHLRRENVAAERELRLSRERELTATEERLYTDGLTGLPNRNRLIVDAPSFRSPTLLLINVDHFKGVNDFYGNKLGDQVLLELRRRIESRASPRPHRLYRLHADEYALVLEGELPRTACLDFGGEIHAACTTEPYEIADQHVRLDCSIGISQTAGALLEHADMALDEARSHGASVRIYDPSMETMRQYAANVRWVGTIRDALKADAVFPVFQPIRDNRTRGVSKFESLIRLRTEAGEIVTPGSFLAVAKAAKLYPELSRRVIRKSFAAFDGLDTEFSVNISIEDILQEETLATIRECLRVYDVRGRVVFEILESEGIHRYDLASSFIEAVKSEGCKIAIDDFGSGYSNFEHILRLKVDYLKLDASLVQNLDGDRQAYAIVETIQRFAERLGLLTIAEHVHSAEIQGVVEALGVHYSQGYFIGEPGPLPL